MAKQLLASGVRRQAHQCRNLTFADLDKLDIVGIFPNYDSAYKAWRGAAQRTVDDAQTRYFIVHLHRLMDPEDKTPQTG